MTIITQHRFTEGSGTTAADSAATPADMTLVPNGATGWVADSGDGYSFSGATNPGYGASSANPAKIDALAGGETFTLEAFCTIPASEPNTAGLVYGVWSFGDGNVCAYQNRSGQIWGYYNGFAAFHHNSTPVGPAHHYTVYDANQATAAARHLHYINGQPVTVVDEGHPSLDEALIDGIYIGCGSNFDDQYSGVVYFGQLQNIAGTASEAIAHALRLNADNDTDPDAAGANIYAGGQNSATVDASTAVTDHTAAPTVTLKSSSAANVNRVVIAAITGFTVTTGVTTCTLDGVAGTRIIQTTSSLASLADAELFWWPDSALASAAGTATASIVVDGASGTLCTALMYFEGVSQTTPTNTGSATGTGTSVTATLGSNVGAGSILVGVLFNLSNDTPTQGSNQIGVSQQNGTTTGDTHRHVSSAKYCPSSGSDSLSWSVLTSGTGKIGIALELAVAGAAPPAAAQQLNSLFFGSM